MKIINLLLILFIVELLIVGCTQVNTSNPSNPKGTGGNPSGNPANGQVNGGTPSTGGTSTINDADITVDPGADETDVDSLILPMPDNT